MHSRIKTIIVIIFHFILCDYLHAAMLAPGLTRKRSDALSDRYASEYANAAKQTDLGNENWKHAESAHFVFHYTNELQLKKAYQESTFYLKTISKDIQLKDVPHNMKKFHIWIFADENEWGKFCYKVHYNHFSPGFSSPGHREFFANFSKLGREGSGLLSHELSHLILVSAIKNNLPIWFHEGFAEYEKDEAYARLKNVRVNPEYMRLDSNRIIPIRKLVYAKDYPKSGYRGKETPLFYNHAELLVRTMIETYGMPSFVHLGKLLGSGRTFEQAILEAFNTDINTLNRLYESNAKKHLK